MGLVHRDRAPRPAGSAPDAAAAQVSRSAAIWVAAITAIGGFSTAVVSGSFGLLQAKPKPTVQRWVRIESVQLASDPTLPRIDRVRVVAQVNSVSYSYPTSVNSIWAPVGQGMPAERYPLPLGGDSFRVRFYAFGYTPDQKVLRYESRAVIEYPLRQLPVRGHGQTLQLASSSPLGLVPAMTVKFTIE